MNSYYIVVVLLVVLALVWIMKLIGLIPQSFFVYSTTIVSIIGIMVVWVEFLRYTIRKKEYLYLSFTYKDMETAKTVANNIKGLPVKRGLLDIRGGSNIDLAVSKAIKNSSICLVLLGGKIEPAQKYEIKEMQRMHKRVIPIMITESSEVPFILSKVKPVLFKDFMKSVYYPLE